ncbi:TPA: single-stranded DNA-binding protein [bacterium]|nr:single-stranded DNA-binding protein [bacterium]
MVSVNYTIVAGNLTHDPELRYTPSGSAVAKFGLAINRVYTTSSGERKEEVDYIPIVVWGKQAENCSQYLSKGRSVLVEGRLRHRSWETPDGQKRSRIEVMAFRVQFLGGRPSEGEVLAGVKGPPGEPIITDEEEEEVPF